jgi:hypothetical protein
MATFSRSVMDQDGVQEVWDVAVVGKGCLLLLLELFDLAGYG